MDFLRQQLFNIIAFVFLCLFVAVWGSVLLRVGFWVPDGRTLAPPLNGALVTAAGVLATSLSSLTASALGFTIAEVRRDESEQDARRPSGSEGSSTVINPSDVTARLSEIALYDLPDDYFAVYVSRIMAVAAEHVQAAAKRHLDPERMIAVVAGDCDAIEQPLRSLGIGSVEVIPAPAWA